VKLYLYVNMNDREVKGYVDRKPDDAVEKFIGVTDVPVMVDSIAMSNRSMVGIFDPA